MNIPSAIFTNLLTMLKKLPIIARFLIIVAVFVGISFMLYGNGNNTTKKILTIERGDLRQVVEFSGIIAPQKRVELAFERSGKVMSATVGIGDTVARGDILASLNTSSIIVDIDQQEAILLSELATLDEIKNGTREEELNIERAKIKQREANVAEKRETLITTILSNYSTVNTAIYKTVDDIFNNSLSTLPTVKYTSSNRSLEITIENERQRIGSMLETWQEESTALISSGERSVFANIVNAIRSSLTASVLNFNSDDNGVALEIYTDNSMEYLLRTRAFLQDVSSYTENLLPLSSLTQSEIDELQTAIATERSNVNTAITYLRTADENLISAETELEIGQSRLVLLEAGSTDEAIARQQAIVNSAQARIDSLWSQWQEFIIYAPVSGVVVQKNIEEGEMVSAGIHSFTLDTVGSYKIEAHISELDIIFLRDGMEAEITLDAYTPEDKWEATITQVDPADSMVRGERGYGVTLVFSEQDDRLKAGMTANALLDIILKEDVISIPNAYIEKDGDTSFVYVLSIGGTVEKREVKIGKRTTLGDIEIASGLTEGEEIVIYE